MIFKYFLEMSLITNLVFTIVADRNCSILKSASNFKFYLWKSNQRSLKERLFVDNVDNLQACKELARKFRGLALNYSSKERFLKQHSDRISSRDHYWDQPHLYFNCHILQCPENDKFKTMANDTSFDYFSLYEKPMASDYICLPEVGMFMLHMTPETYQNASLKCRHLHNHCGTLAHVASQKRTEALTHLITRYSEQIVLQYKPKVNLAYIGLRYNSTWSNNLDFFNDEMENLKCFAYRAWEPGNPKMSSEFTNASCAALTVSRSWKTVKCDRKLPFICEISTSCMEKEIND